MALLELNKLNLSIGDTPILKDVSFSIGAGETLGLVGESGSGKSMSALAIMQLLPRSSSTSGSISFAGEELLNFDEHRMCALRGDDIGMVFQEPMTALNPVKTIGEQVSEGIRLHTGANRKDAKIRASKMLDRVGLPAHRFPLNRYPHELSGGQRQRVVIAIACALNPKLLIADEPTTALDVTLQAQILDLLNELVLENNMGLLLISHDLAVVTEMASKIVVLRNGEVKEAGETATVLKEQKHPYTRQLAEASTHVPTRKTARVSVKSAQESNTVPLLSVENLIREYQTPRKSLFQKGIPFRAVDQLSFELYPGHSLGLVGESGCGKSTLARAILGLERPNGGHIVFDGTDFATATDEEIKRARRNIQVVFQDPYGSFNPRHKVARLVAEPLHLMEAMSDKEKRDRVAKVLVETGLATSDMDKYAHEFSGGQRQRIAIARALITQPKLIIADEPVSALDVSIRAQVLDLLSDLQDRLGLAYLFISHDLSVVRAITDDVLVMNQGIIVEHGPTAQVFDHPADDYTKKLVTAAPDLERAIMNRLNLA